MFYYEIFIDMKTLIRKLLRESLDSSYEFKEVYFDTKIGEIEYSFITNSNEEVSVNFHINSRNELGIDFMLDYSWFKNKETKDIFRLFSTIVMICEKVITKLKELGFNIKYLSYDADQKKGSLYKKIITRLVPNAKFSTNQYKSTVVKIK